MITANTSGELLSALDAKKVIVPLRTDGRTTTHTETYAIVESLKFIAESGDLDYPVSLKKHERPDFIFRHGNMSLGIEHTEVVCPNVAASDALRERGHGPYVYYPRKSKPGERRLSAKKLIQEIEENDPGMPWMGDSVEENWAEAMAYHVHKKTDLYRSITFGTNEKWLLLYDNWRSPGIDMPLAIEELKLSLSNLDTPFFDKLLVLTDGELFLLGSNGVLVARYQNDPE